MNKILNLFKKPTFSSVNSRHSMRCVVIGEKHCLEKVCFSVDFT